MAHTRIAEMAAYHVGKVRSVQPRGPYLLAGMCAGGVIAYEMARQLQSQGERVALVALLDAADPAAPPKAWRVAGQRLQRFGGVFREAGPASPVRRALSILGKVLEEGPEPGGLHGRGTPGIGRGTRSGCGSSAPGSIGAGGRRGPGQDLRADRLPVRRAGLPPRRPFRRGAGAVPGHRAASAPTSRTSSDTTTPCWDGAVRDPGRPRHRRPRRPRQYAPGAPRRGPGRADAVLHRPGPGRRARDDAAAGPGVTPPRPPGPARGRGSIHEATRRDRVVSRDRADHRLPALARAGRSAGSRARGSPSARTAPAATRPIDSGAPSSRTAGIRGSTSR